MSLTRILILAGAALAAIVAAVLVNGSGGKKPPAQQVEVVGPSVLVAANIIKVGEKIAPEDLAWRPFPADGVGPGMITKDSSPKALESTTGAFARTEIQAGAPIFPNQFVQAGDSHFMAAVLTPGARAASLPISEENAAGGFILPNDRVDVVLTREQDVMIRAANGGAQNVKQVSTSTVLRNIRVLAVDQEYQDVKEGEAIKGATATLELWPAQVERLEKAKKQGEVSLALRSVSNEEGSPESGKYAGSYGEDSSDGSTQTAVRIHGYSYPTEAVIGQ